MLLGGSRNSENTSNMFRWSSQYYMRLVVKSNSVPVQVRLLTSLLIVQRMFLGNSHPSKMFHDQKSSRNAMHCGFLLTTRDIVLHYNVMVKASGLQVFWRHIPLSKKKIKSHPWLGQSSKPGLPLPTKWMESPASRSWTPGNWRYANEPLLCHWGHWSPWYQWRTPRPRYRPTG